MIKFDSLKDFIEIKETFDFSKLKEKSSNSHLKCFLVTEFPISIMLKIVPMKIAEKIFV
jgi:hypothetical protein